MQSEYEKILRLFNLKTYLVWNRNLQICFGRTILAEKHVTVHCRFKKNEKGWKKKIICWKARTRYLFFIFKAPSTRKKLYENMQPILPEPIPVSVAFKWQAYISTPSRCTTPSHIQAFLGPVYMDPDKCLHGKKLARLHLAFTRDRRNWTNIWTAKCASLGTWKKQVNFWPARFVSYGLM